MDKECPFRIMIERMPVRPLRVGSRSDEVHIVVDEMFDCILRIILHMFSLMRLHSAKVPLRATN